MESIFKAVICGEKGILLYAKLLPNGQKKYFAVDASMSELNNSYEITELSFAKQIQLDGLGVFYIEDKVKYPAIMLIGLDISWEPLFEMFLFESKVEKIFSNIININNTTEHYELLDIEKAFYSDSGLYNAVSNRLETWYKQNSLPDVVKTKEKICYEHGYVKLLNLINSLEKNKNSQLKEKK